MNFNNDKQNMTYYNQILGAYQKKQAKNTKQNKETKNVTFIKQEVNLKDYFYVPDGLEPFVYIFYFVAIPYIIGAIFLFFTIAGGDFNNFKLLNISAFFIVWAIGYEIVATLLLVGILVMFLKQDDDDSDKRIF